MKARPEFLPFSPPFIGEEEINEVVDTLKSNWITTGPKTKRFEKEFADTIKAPAALALNSCTAALHTALAGLGIGEGDEVITTTMTFAATVGVIEHVKARPVLVDVDPATLCLDPDRVEAAITPRTKAILPVHYSGHPADMDVIAEIARSRNIYIVEDAAHALPAKYKGRYIGQGDNPVAFSFYATKNITTAEGGMLTGNPEFIDKARIISLHGMNHDAWKRYDDGGSWYYEIVYPGFKYNMTDIQASLGICQLKKLEDFQKRRREIVRAYNRAFSTLDSLETPVELSYAEHSWHLYVLRLNLETLRISRDRFIEELKERNIGTSVHFIPIHLHPYYRDKYGFRQKDFPVAFDNYQRMISLPLYPKMVDRDIEDVVEAVIEVAKENRR